MAEATGTSKSWFDTIYQFRQTSFDAMIIASDPQSQLAQYMGSRNDQVNVARYEPVPQTLDQSVLFSSTSIPNRREMLNDTALPCGLLLSPFDRPVLTTSSFDYYPPRCAHCSAYLNIYCRLEEHPVHHWVCAVCRHSNSIDSGTKGVRSIWEVKHGLGWWATDAYRTVLASDLYDIKRRRASPQTSSAAGTAVTVDSRGGGISDPISSSNVLADEQTTTTTTTTLTSNALDQGTNAMYIFIVDENLPRSELTIIQQALRQLHSNISGTAQIALISCAKVVSIYEMATSTTGVVTATAHTSAKLIYGGQSLSSSDSFALKLKKKLFMDTVASGAEKFMQSFQSIISASSRGGSAPETAPIALGVAIECALSFISTSVDRSGTGSNSNGGRLFVFLSGVPSFGPGALSMSARVAAERSNELDAQNSVAKDYYTQLGQRAYQKSVAIDLHLCGFHAFASRYLTPLCMPTGNIFITHELNDIDRSDMTYRNMLNAINKHCGVYSRLDVHCPEAISLTHIIGPTVKASGKQLPEHALDVDDKIGNTDKYASFELTSHQQDITYALYYELQEDVPQDYIHIQFVVRILDDNYNRILRVITKRIKTTGNFDKYLNTLDLNVMAVLQTKKIVLAAGKAETTQTNGESFDYQDELDKQLKTIAKKCAKVQRGWFSKTVTIPEKIKQYIRL
ncbi:hypothetical protein SAMD00019534_025630 [Acytostelium subglobosum LB1]|uniref:hypothetical protein n=1 Tax=Acytostelium subglobosum LB1 TaxID=1410327 RepID=UPI000644BE12|nr:hypothetical protein SAMD00019534_025630 [Acytostelium subglobosum LB1]GAM19388.1 hypothetical protein SAMD00019534_025630 [Acytostelium subglobosum LB1]|eukprot:XP_012757315.1 hypothetical protein SAMD00019534_025630 [Acytostelium subglobosum LB1]